MLSHYLTEFQYSKVDEIEVPGQYTEVCLAFKSFCYCLTDLQDKDSNQNFVRIQKFAPKFEICRSNGFCWKRFTLHGSDNSRTSFAVQLPCHRHYRREDRMMQILRTFNRFDVAPLLGRLLKHRYSALNRKKESRKRNLFFHLPATVSCSPNVRLFQTDSSYITLGDIYDRYCNASGISKEEPVLYTGEKVKKVLREYRQPSTRQVR